jgi:hypothetical protein
MALKYNQTAARMDGTIGAFQRDGGDTWGGVGGGTPPAFPKGSAEIVPFGQDSPFLDIETLAEGIKVEEAACKLQI